jgi:type I restriction enzyme S subunit
MNEWREVTLGSISETISYGYTESASIEEVGPKFLRITDIASTRLKWNNVPYCPITDSNFEKYKLYPGDIVIARTGATTGANYILKPSDPKNVVYASYLIRYQIDNDLAYPFYVGHILQSITWKEFVKSIAGGSAQPGANAKELGSFEFLLPPLPEQKAIAEVLSSLDDKIDLLHRQNETLEQMAQTLFRQWFVEEAEDDWEEIEFGEFLTPQKGKNLTRAKAIDGPYPVVAGGLEPMCTHNKSNTEEPVITVSASGANAGFVRLYNQKVWSSDSSFIDKTITPYVYFSYLFLKFNQEV